MKKLYSLSLLLVASFSFAQSVVITSVVDGTLLLDGCSGTTTAYAYPKIVELYVSGTVDLYNYRVQVEANGGASPSWSQGLYLNGTFTDSFIYLVNLPDGAQDVQVFHELYPNLTGNNVFIDAYAPSINGNDAIRVATYDAVGPDANLVAVVDVFGNSTDITGSSDYSAAWAYADGYAKRVSGTPANGGTFVNTSFTYSGNDALDNTTCANFVTTVNLGSYSTVAGVNEHDIAGLKVYPNPLSGNVLNITSNTNGVKEVAIYDMIGKQVFTGKTVNNTVNVNNLTAGVYIVNITEEGKTAARKLVIK